MGLGRMGAWGTAGAVALYALASACLPDVTLPAAPVDDAGPLPITGPVCGNGIIEGADGGETCDPGDASVNGCTGCRVTCEGVLDPITQHCYFSAGPSADLLGGAATLCSAAGAHVVTLDSDAERAIVDGLADGGAYWVGLSATAAVGAYVTSQSGVDIGLEPGWPEPARNSGPCPGCYGLGRDGGGFDPLDDAGAAAASFACVAASGPRWYGVPCVGPSLGTICEREPRGQRSQGCGGALCFTVPKTASSGSYVLLPGFTSADVAKRSCEELGAHLVVFESAEEREEIVRELLTVVPFDPLDGRLAKQDYWIGLAAENGGAFTWADGVTEAARPVPWGNREPRAASGPAVLHIDAIQYDTGLVSVETRPGEQHPALCER